jgi:hypothetical protein
MKNVFLSFTTLASFASMATVWAACTVTTNPAATTDGGTTGSDATTGTDAKQPKKDGGAVGDTDAAPVACIATPTAAQFDSLYKPAKPKQAGACTAAEITKLDAANTAAEIKAAASAKCLACAVSPETDATWALTLVDAAGDFLDVNAGACYEIAVSPTCGKFNAKFQGCGALACDACTNDSDFKACQDEAYADVAPIGLCRTKLAAGEFGTCSEADITKGDAACGDTYISALTYLCGN